MVIGQFLTTPLQPLTAMFIVDRFLHHYIIMKVFINNRAS